MRKSWVVTGSDDMQVRVFNYNTLEKVHTFEAHTDYIRSIIVHPTHPYVLTSSGELRHLVKRIKFGRSSCECIHTVPPAHIETPENFPCLSPCTLCDRSVLMVQYLAV